MERGSENIHSPGSAKAGYGCWGLTRMHWGPGKLSNRRVLLNLGWRQTPAEESLLLNTHLAQVTGQWCLVTHRAERYNSDSPQLFKNKVTQITYLLLFFKCTSLCMTQPKIPPCFCVTWKPFRLCESVSPREPSRGSIPELESAHGGAIVLREAVGMFYNQ